MISCVPSEGTRLPSGQAHHIDCTSLPSQVLGGILICSASHAHDNYHITCRTFAMFPHAVSFWPPAARPLLHIQLCHRSRTTSPDRRDFSDLFLTLLTVRSVKTVTRTARLVTGSVFLSCSQESSRTSSLRLATNVCTNPTKPSVRGSLPKRVRCLIWNSGCHEHSRCCLHDVQDCQRLLLSAVTFLQLPEVHIHWDHGIEHFRVDNGHLSSSWRLLQPTTRIA